MSQFSRKVAIWSCSLPGSALPGYHTLPTSDAMLRNMCAVMQMCTSNKQIGWSNSGDRFKAERQKSEFVQVWKKQPEKHDPCSSNHVHFCSHVRALSCPALNLLMTVTDVTDAHCRTFTGRRPLSAEQPGSSSRLNTARQLMDVTMHYMHHSLNTVLPLPRTPFCPYIDGYGLQHVITVIGSLWGDPLQSNSVSPQRGMLKGRMWSSVSMSDTENVGRSLVASQNNWCPLMLRVNPTDVDFLCL